MHGNLELKRKSSKMKRTRKKILKRFQCSMGTLVRTLDGRLVYLMITDEATDT